MVTAYSYEADGAVLPVQVGGHAALDFCNTRAGWGEAEPKEYLRGYDALALWARDAGLVDAGAARRLREEALLRPQEAEAVLRRALRLREAVHRTILDDTAWEDVAAEAESAAREARLRPSGWELPERLDLPVLAVARATADFLLGGGRAVVQACPGAQCGWLFLDPRGRRRWCSMATCGNRSKQRRHRARRRSAS